MAAVFRMPLARAAEPALVILGRLRASGPPPDPALLRDRLAEAMIRFDLDARRAGCPDAAVSFGFSMLSALAVQFGLEGRADNAAVFSAFGRFAAAPKDHLPELELALAGFDLGYAEDGHGDPLRAEAIARLRGTLALRLAPVRGRRRRRMVVPAMVVGAVAIAIGCGVVVLSPPIKAPIPLSAIEPAAPVVWSSGVPIRLAQTLADPLAAGEVELVSEPAVGWTIRVVTDPFEEGGEGLRPAALALLRRIAAMLVDEPGWEAQVIVYAGQAAVPSLRFDSNLDLAQARADVVTKLLGPEGTVKRTVKAGDPDPASRRRLDILCRSGGER